MSLIGSLDDLGLGDILQIINLSQKSGVLTVMGDAGEGRIVFRDGLVRGAARKGGPHTLRDLLVGGGVLSDEVYQSAVESGGESGVANVLFERELITVDQLVKLSRDAVEDAVVAMFSWQSGEFSFDVRSDGEPGDPRLLLETGINAQFLAMEGARRLDEQGQSDGDELEFGVSEPEGVLEQDELDGRAAAIDFVAERAAGAVATQDGPAAHPARDPTDDVAAPRAEAAVIVDAVVDAPAVEAAAIADAVVYTGAIDASVDEAAVVDATLVAAPAIDTEALLRPVPEADPEGEAIPAVEVYRDSDLAEVATDSDPSSESETASTPEWVSPVATSPGLAEAQAPVAPPRRPPVVVIDPELRALEWTKQVLKSDFEHVHIFQQSSLGLVRIRQYLSRAEIPLVLISPDASGEPAAGIRDSSDFVARLKTQAKDMLILWLSETPGPPAKGSADGVLTRPRLASLRDASAAYECDEIADVLRGQLFEELRAEQRPPSSGIGRQDRTSDLALRRLRAATKDLSAASARGEVLPRVIEFARESFSRVAMFLVRDGRAEGMAESGLSGGGGPDHSAFCDISLAVSDCSWFERVLDHRSSVATAPSEADGALCDLLCGPGSKRPLEAYVAPIESSGQIIALLYADHLPAQRAIGDTSALEVVLSHAGLALDRALLERALHEVGGEAPGASREESSE